MAKAVLVVRMPENCSECNLCKKMEDGCNYCMVDNRIIVNVSSRKFSCHLKPMPEKTIPFPVDDEEQKQFCKGWNACIDAICGKE